MARTAKSIAEVDGQVHAALGADLRAGVDQQIADTVEIRQGEIAESDRSRGVIAIEHIAGDDRIHRLVRSEEHTSELQSLMRISYAVFCLKKKKTHKKKKRTKQHKN